MSNKDVIIYSPKPDQIKAEAKQLESMLSKDALARKVMHLQATLKRAMPIRYCDADGKIMARPPKPFEHLMSKNVGKLRKNEMAQLLAAFTSDSRNMLTEFHLWSDVRQQLVRNAAEFALCTESEMDAVLESKQYEFGDSFRYIFDRVNDRYDDSYPLDTWIEFDKVSSYGAYQSPSRAIYGKLPCRWQLAIYQLMHQDIGQPFPTVSPTDLSGEGYVHVNLHEHIANALTYMVQAYRSDVINRGVTRIIAKSELKKVKAAELNMNPFAGGPLGEVLDGYFAQSLAVHFMNLQLSGIVPYRDQTMPEGLPLIEAMINATDYLTNIQMFELILPHLSGFKGMTMNKFEYRPYVVKIKELLKTDGQNWLDVQALKHKVYHHAIAMERPLIMTYGIDSADLHSDMSDDYVSAPTLNIDVMYPFIEGILAQLMAMGVVEGVFAPLEDGARSYFSGLKYVRLTELGQAAFGLINGYELLLTDKYARQYDLIDGPLLVYSRIPDNPNDNILADIAVKTGRYWKVTPQSFLRNCGTTDDIQHYITVFKQSICKKPSAAWQQFFDTLLAKASRGPKKDSSAWIVMNVSPDDTELQSLLCTDEFREIALRAEDYKILVKKTDKEKFANLMKSHGYLLPLL